MEAHCSFTPPRRLGLIFQSITMLTLIFIGLWGLWQAAQAEIGPAFLITLLPGLIAVALLPFLIYQFYALRNGRYWLERDGIRLRWGLRQETIPMDQINWVVPASQLNIPMPLPWLRLPGAVTGTRRFSAGGVEYLVEFMAARGRGLVFIGVGEKIFAISPQDSQVFLHTFQRHMEMGSLTPLEARSIHPTFLIGQIWSTPTARWLLISGLLVWLVLLLRVSLTIPGLDQIPMGFQPDGSPGDLVPAVRLLLLPVISAFFYLVDLIGGIFFFRRDPSGSLAYLLWASGVITPILSLLAVFFILES